MWLPNDILYGMWLPNNILYVMRFPNKNNKKGNITKTSSSWTIQMGEKTIVIQMQDLEDAKEHACFLHVVVIRA